MNDAPPCWWQRPRTLALLILLTAVPLLWPPLPPLTDLPAHMGRYRVMLGTDADTLSQWFDFEWKLIGYIGFDLIVNALAPFLGLEMTVKLLVLLTAMASAAGILWISREAHGRVQPLAILALPFVYNLAFQFGFLNYCLAMACTLNAFALWLRLGRLEKLRLRAAIFVPISCAIWLIHVVGWLVLGLFCFAAELMRRREAGRGWIAAIWWAGLSCIPLALPFLRFLSWQPGGEGTADWLGSLAYKPGWFAMALRDRWPVLDIGAMGLAAVLFYHAIRSPEARFAPRLAASAIGLLLLFVAMPFLAAYADARLAPFVIILALLAIRMEGRTASRIALIALAFFGVRTIATTTSFAIAGADWQQRLVALDHVPRGQRVLGLVTAPCEPQWAMFRIRHLTAMAIVRRASFTNDQFDLGNSATLKIIAPGVEGFAMDPSHTVTPYHCGLGDFRTVEEALRDFPRDRFDYVWLLDAPAIDAGVTAGLTPVWRDEHDQLFRIHR
ncbi:hypothetical protein [Stakelama tenebrarum]|uniref:Glycosyltransferase RgtA/B/C/D-like domain-containing protein n=1 Tax=Stakelama tenebrarum TaxID=2711215 RepID=A0A6G6Y925_9SPHN|nr:hypothetical protein [Sphingosinithalassobacter tenebrarum]QIG81442.1 hypothetical protein G5C33_17715 [Sphingosinithalassobacter tenebrarum]